jgi:hypothetical protein
MHTEYSATRRYPRIPSKNTILVKKLDTPAPGRLTRTQVLGLGGCMFLSDDTIGVGSHLSLHIAIKERFIRSKARVVYEIPNGDRYEVGVQFIEITPEERALLETVFQQTEELALVPEPPLNRENVR